jgi:hypothetical protein
VSVQVSPVAPSPVTPVPPPPAFAGRPDDGSDAFGVIVGSGCSVAVCVGVPAVVGLAVGFFAGSSSPEHE